MLTPPKTSCILSKFYIKPQPTRHRENRGDVVSYRNSTSNHNQIRKRVKRRGVVSYRNSTSNHNRRARLGHRIGVVSYRNSTSNHNNFGSNVAAGFVVSYRNSTSNHNQTRCPSQSTNVVSYRNSTSNHNSGVSSGSRSGLYLIEILHQTTTHAFVLVKKQPLYLIEILHQTTTKSAAINRINGCILSKFYIKPQQSGCSLTSTYVVSYRNSTSNHNRLRLRTSLLRVVSYRNSTSNHNDKQGKDAVYELYLIEILHQTTTLEVSFRSTWGCILSKFYIKPQLRVIK